MDGTYPDHNAGPTGVTLYILPTIYTRYMPMTLAGVNTDTRQHHIIDNTAPCHTDHTHTHAAVEIPSEGEMQWYAYLDTS